MESEKRETLAFALPRKLGWEKFKQISSSQERGGTRAELVVEEE
jgi:hypothetical protein